MVVKYLDFYSICLQLFCQTHWEDYRDLGGYSSLKLSSHRHIYICLSVCLSFCLPACLSVCILILRISKEHIPRQRLRLTSHLREWQEEKRRLAGGGKKESEEVLIGSGGSSRLSGGVLPGQNDGKQDEDFSVVFAHQWDNRRSLDTAFLWAGERTRHWDKKLSPVEKGGYCPLIQL